MSFDDQSIRRIRDVVLANERDPAQASKSTDQPIFNLVEVTSSTANSSGEYPGKIVTYNASSATWNDLGACSVRAATGGFMLIGDRHVCRFTGLNVARDAGLWVADFGYANRLASSVYYPGLVAASGVQIFGGDKIFEGSVRFQGGGAPGGPIYRDPYAIAVGQSNSSTGYYSAGFSVNGTLTSGGIAVTNFGGVSETLMSCGSIRIRKNVSTGSWIDAGGVVLVCSTPAVLAGGSGSGVIGTLMCGGNSILGLGVTGTGLPVSGYFGEQLSFNAGPTTPPTTPTYGVQRLVSSVLTNYWGVDADVAVGASTLKFRGGLLVQIV